MTVDPHKMGMAAIPAGGIIFRDAKALDFIKTETPYLTDSYQYTFVGTRTGASAASAWAVFSYLGVEGFKKVVDKCMKTPAFLLMDLKMRVLSLSWSQHLTSWLSAARRALRVWLRSFGSSGWFVSYVPRYDCIRIVVMPHVKKRHAEAFLKDLAEIEKL